MVVEIDVSGPQSVALDEFIVAWRPLILCVASQHALKTHADALNILHRTPALLAEQIKAYNAVRVDVRMYWYGSVWQLDEGHFGRFYPDFSLRTRNMGRIVDLYKCIPIGYWSPNLNSSLKVLSR